ncbi:MAG: hypothetical protein ACRDFT_07685 [bacterium]
MRAHVKALLFGLFVIIGVSWVSEAWAFIPAGGSRLLYYYSKRSFASGAGVDSAQTLFQIINTNETQAVRVGVKYYRGDNCDDTSVVYRNISAGGSVTIDVADETPGTFQEGVAEAFFVNAGNQPIRWDRGVGSSIIIDYQLVAILRLAAALLHSDDRTSQGGVIANAASPTSWAPSHSAAHFQQPSLVTSRLAMFAPGTNSGTVSPDRTFNLHFRRPNGSGDADRILNAACGRTLTLGTIFGFIPPGIFGATYPDGGIVAADVEGSGQQKGAVGWLIESIQLASPPINLLFGQIFQAFGTQSESAHP